MKLAPILCCCLAAARASSEQPLSDAAARASSEQPLSFIRASNVVGDKNFYDEHGRVRIFHGANRVAKGFPWLFPDQLDNDGEATLMEELGFNVLRLGWMWTGYNGGGPGQFNETYGDALGRIVSRLAARGVHVLLDMHEDVLSSDFCLYDGAPQWVVNKSVPRHAFPWPQNGSAPGDPRGCHSRGWEANMLTEAAGQAYQDIYDNYAGMLDDLAAFWAKSAARWRDEPAVIGYEVMNEPFAGDVFKDPLLFLPGVAGRKNLARMHDAVAAAIRQHDDRHMIFYEPVTWGMVLDGKATGSGYDHVPGGPAFANRSAMSYHYYCSTFDPGWQDHPLMRRAICDATVGPLVFKAVGEDLDKVGGAQMMTEGMACPTGNLSQAAECVAVMDDLDKRMFSWTDYGDSQGQTWEPTEVQKTVWARTYARAVAGTPLNMTFDFETKDFETCFTIDASINAPTEIFASVKYAYNGPGGFAVATSDNLAASSSGNIVTVVPAPGADAGGEVGCVRITKA